MTPKEQNILDVVNLLVLLNHSKKLTSLGSPDNDSVHLVVTKEHLDKSRISITVFINTLNLLDKKGYLLGVTIFEDKYHSAIEELFKEPNYQNTLAQIEALDTELAMQQGIESITDILESKAPQNFTFDREVLKDEKITLGDTINSVKHLFANHSKNDIGIVLLSPLRSIDRLLRMMNEGINFDDVKDSGIWYDKDNFLFYIEDEAIPTSYNNKPNKEHFILSALFKTGVSRIHYDDIPEFDSSKHEEVEMKSFSDAFLRFIAKHPKLPNIFTVQKYQLDINKKYLEHTY